MDPVNFIQFSLYSKLMNEGMNMIEKNIIDQKILILIVLCMIIMKMIPSRIYDFVNTNIDTFFEQIKDECIIIIPYHIKTYSCSIGIKSITKTTYSDRFLALNHYLKNAKEITSFVEITNFENCGYYDKCDYVLLPNNSQKIKICDKHDIFFEIVIEKTKDYDAIDDKSNQIKRVQTKNYIYKISKEGKQNIDILNDFMKLCIDEYNEYNAEKKQMIYEYMKTSIDDEDRQCMTFDDSPFKSNKTFDNLFFEGKEEIRKDIQEFVMNMEKTQKQEIEAEYKRKGIPFKRIYLLYGPPGTGKSSLIKAFVNETGRHCILVQWSKIKTSTEFSNLFHKIKINSKKILQSEIIIVFEDFDANNTSVVKIRDNLKKTWSNSSINLLQEKEKEDTDKNTKNILETIITAQMKTCDDSLTLECILNVLDGIKELNDAVIVFTTNDITCIDPAVIRPGRVDKLIKMDYIKAPIIKQIVKHYYNTDDTECLQKLDTITEAMSPAMVQTICIKNKNIWDCVNEITLCK